MTAPALKALIARLHELAAIGCLDDAGDSTCGIDCMAFAPTDPRDWCRSCVMQAAAEALARPAVSTERPAPDILGYDGLVARIERHLEDVMSPSRTHLLLGEASRALQRLAAPVPAQEDLPEDAARVLRDHAWKLYDGQPLPPVPALAPQWQPMETRPDGCENIVGSWFDGSSREVGELLLVTEKWLCLMTDLWVEPTHWMPLPAPPALTEKEQP